MQSDAVLDAWDELRIAIDRVVCSLPHQLTDATACMVSAQARFGQIIKAAAMETPND